MTSKKWNGNGTVTGTIQERQITVIFPIRGQFSKLKLMNEIEIRNAIHRKILDRIKIGFE